MRQKRFQRTAFPEHEPNDLLIFSHEYNRDWKAAKWLWGRP